MESVISPQLINKSRNAKAHSEWWSSSPPRRSLSHRLLAGSFICGWVQVIDTIMKCILEATASASAALFVCLLAASSVPAIEPPRQPHQPTAGGDNILNFNETYLRPAFGPSSIGIQQAASGALVLQNFITGENSTFVAAEQIPAGVVEFWIRPDLKKVLFATNYSKQYRYSYFADYSILDVESGELVPLVEDQAGDIQYAEFAPVGDAIAFVRGNNLFINTNGEITQITEDGGPDMFHAVPDWVYEEEIFASTRPVLVPSGGDVVPSQARELELRYPKVGTKNPTVALSLLDLASGAVEQVPLGTYEADDLVVGELAWLTEEHDNLLVRTYNRVQQHSTHVLVSSANTTSVDHSTTYTTSTIRERDGSDGWLDNKMAIRYVGPVNATDGDWYLDLLDESGWEHIYLFPVSGGEGIALTSGGWEVWSVLKVDPSRELIYFTSTEQHSTERHLYSVNWATQEKTALVPEDIPAYLLERFFLLQRNTPVRVITSNQALWDKIQGYNLPNITYFELTLPSGESINVMERLPPTFDPYKKYPILLTPYAGPDSQRASKSFQSLGWNAYISSDPELEYITYTVDGRGTAVRGRDFRASVAQHLGEFETADQVFAAKELIHTRSYIDADHVGIFGWSYGGYIASKVVEADSGVFTLSLIGAPVTDWRLYDSLYTERYMRTYQDNEAGYNTTAVRNVEGFHNIKGAFSIVHGLGDDNVHYQNSAALVDLLVGAGVSHTKWDWKTFTDTDHGITYNGAGPFVYKHFAQMLWEEKNRSGEEEKYQWSRRAKMNVCCRGCEMDEVCI
ncbi:dipeptidyl peptidase 4 [Pterulicium gracile]|uniref:Dipeptidyl peptidase IV n=1 Tax=Pterulicium gracile TaxID=1884261 RepID=A0A5C3Q0B0_9AGAR|nr:dipeptidyl peptidase 4 [Pterula gracilis]